MNEKIANHVLELRELLGKDVVLLAWPRGSKGTTRKWKHLTVADMTPDYLARLAIGNIGVVHGEKSGDVCCIDIDLDRFVGPFLTVNPCLRDTLQSHGARGRGFWVRCIGDYPKRTIKLKTDTREDVGEFRSNGSQSIIWGIHPKTNKPYEIIHKAKPIEIDFWALNWPEGIVPPKCDAETQQHSTQTNSSASCVLEGCVPTSLDNCVPTSLHNNALTILGNIAAKKEVCKALAIKHPKLAALYESLIEPRFRAVAHGRNDFIVNAVPFLYRAVAERLIPVLVGHFYDCNRALFSDTRDQHMNEANAMLKSVAETYLKSLSSEEIRICAALNELERDAFRICRDLARLPEREREPGTFYLSFSHLADRLGIYPAQAQGIMRQLEGYGLIRLLRKGTRRAPGVKGEAGTYQWQLPPPHPIDPKP